MLWPLNWFDSRRICFFCNAKDSSLPHQVILGVRGGALWCSRSTRVPESIRTVAFLHVISHFSGLYSSTTIQFDNMAFKSNIKDTFIYNFHSSEFFSIFLILKGNFSKIRGAENFEF
jgi:hypothetical protein